MAIEPISANGETVQMSLAIRRIWIPSIWKQGFAFRPRNVVKGQVWNSWGFIGSELERLRNNREPPTHQPLTGVRRYRVEGLCNRPSVTTFS